MNDVESFPVAAQEKQKTPESPDFLGQVTRLEAMAAEGIQTPFGIESFQFRAGIEMEFALLDPQKWRDAVRDDETRRILSHQTTIADIKDEGVRNRITQDHEKALERNRKFQLGTIRNPEAIEGRATVTPELLHDFRTYATDYVDRLPATNEAEKLKREKWLSEIPQFGVSEMINFLLYEEFSIPTLADNRPPETGMLSELDEFADTQGWLEFRFGTGILQSGYYDNEGMSEIRLAPCSPSEAIRRKLVISERLAELASQYGMLVQSTSNHEHINLSVYQGDETGDYHPILGHDDEKQQQTLDVTAGIAEVIQDGVWLSKEDMQWDYNFHGIEFTFSPTRKTIRLLDGRLELRSRFRQTDQGINWLVAGAIAGLSQGHQAIQEKGVETPTVKTLYKVTRNPHFNKQRDLQIQRAFENSSPLQSDERDEGFELNLGYNWMRGTEITEALIGKQSSTQGCDVFNEVVFKCVSINPEGVPVVNATKLLRYTQALSEQSKALLEKFLGPDPSDQIRKINARLATVALEKNKAITGSVNYKAPSIPEAIARIEQSPVAKLAYGDNLGTVTSWLQSGVPGK